MKVCIPTMGGSGMDEALCQHFGRAPTFTVVDMDTRMVQVLTNISEHMGGSGLPTGSAQRPGISGHDRGRSGAQGDRKFR